MKVKFLEKKMTRNELEAYLKGHKTYRLPTEEEYIKYARFGTYWLDINTEYGSTEYPIYVGYMTINMLGKTKHRSTGFKLNVMVVRDTWSIISSVFRW